MVLASKMSVLILSSILFLVLHKLCFFNSEWWSSVHTQWTSGIRNDTFSDTLSYSNHEYCSVYRISQWTTSLYTYISKLITLSQRIRNEIQQHLYMYASQRLHQLQVFILYQGFNSYHVVAMLLCYYEQSVTNQWK